jgi:hypothetical protein
MKVDKKNQHNFHISPVKRFPPLRSSFSLACWETSYSGNNVSKTTTVLTFVANQHKNNISSFSHKTTKKINKAAVHDNFTCTLGMNFLAVGVRWGFMASLSSRSAECIRFICSFNLSLRLNCFPQLAHRNSRWSECLLNKDLNLRLVT